MLVSTTFVIFWLKRGSNTDLLITNLLAVLEEESSSLAEGVVEVANCLSAANY